MSVTGSPPTKRPRLPSVPAPLASHARESPGGMTCGICGRPLEPGQKEAKLLDGRWAHVSPCIVPPAGGRP